MQITWTEQRLFWALNLGAVALAFIAMTSKLGASISVFVMLMLDFVIIIRSQSLERQGDLMRGDLLDLYVSVASTTLFWLPIYVFSGFPALQFNTTAFTVLAAFIITGMVGLVLSRSRLRRVFGKD